MINYLSRNFPGIKSSVLISKQVFEDLIILLSQSISNIKINHNKTIIEFLKKENNLIIYLEIKIAKSEKIHEKIKEINNKIEQNCALLLDTKPQNIYINFVGQY